LPEFFAQWQRETRTGLALLPFTYRVDWYIEIGWKLEEIVTCDEFVSWDDLASIASLSSLQRLALPSAKLGDVGARAIAENLINLHFLLLGDNRLTDDAVRRLVEGLPLLETIRVQGNESLRLPQELMGTTNAAGLRDYFRRAQSEGKRKLNEAELIVVGNEAVGKTALVNYLIKDEPCSDTDKTPGLHIQERIEVTPWDTHHTTRDPKEDQDGGKGIVELRQTIIDTIRREIPQASVEFPLSYFEVKERLREIAKASIRSISYALLTSAATSHPQSPSRTNNAACCDCSRTSAW
jgi:hypothetical protein